MNKSVKSLELDKILAAVAQCAGSEKGKQKRCLLCFLPAALCAAIAAAYWIGSFTWWAT